MSVIQAIWLHYNIYKSRSFTVQKIYMDAVIKDLKATMNTGDKQLLCANGERYLEQAMGEPIVNVSGRGDHVLEHEHEHEHMVETTKDRLHSIKEGVPYFKLFPKLIIIEMVAVVFLFYNLSIPTNTVLATTPPYTIMT